MEVHRASFGKDGMIDFLRKLKNEGYETKYYVDRLLDMPLIGSDNDIRSLNIDDIISMLSSNEELVPNVFHLLFVKENHRREKQKLD
jgi:hypothetical protein